MNNQYEDIINLPHHVSTKRPHMSLCDRAAQFSPFAALTGYDAAIQETARLTAQQTDLSKDRIEAINAVLRILGDYIEENPDVRICYFKPDNKKAGGSYLSITGTAKKIDEFGKRILLAGGTSIPIQDIFSIESDSLHISSDAGFM